MATNFNIKRINENGAIIRLLANDYLIDCRFPKDMPDNQRMGWLKQTANEALVNMGHADQVVSVPSITVEIGEEIVNDEVVPIYATLFAPESATDNLPDADEDELVAEGVTTNATWWDKIKGFFS